MSAKSATGSVFNGLKVVAAGAASGLGEGELKFIYDRYVSPARAGFSFQVIVKVLPVVNADQQRVAIVPALARFEDDGFVVRLLPSNGVPLTQAILEVTQVVVEVSEYGKLVSIP